MDGQWAICTPWYSEGLKAEAHDVMTLLAVVLLFGKERQLSLDYLCIDIY